VNPVLTERNISARGVLLALGLNAIWINASEVFRYFVFVMPMMRASLPEIDGVAPMNWPVFLIWGVWDTILLIGSTGIFVLWFAVFGLERRQALAAGAFVWAGIFGILWIGLWNMNLASLLVLAIALPLSLLEMIVAAFITRGCLDHAGRRLLTR
jgi:hypothetical protein